MSTVGISFRVPGKPIPQGSARAIINNNTGRAVLIGSRRTELSAYRADIAEAYARASQLAGLAFDGVGAFGVDIIFSFQRPASHFGTGKLRTLKPSAPEHMLTMPDIDKLTRAVLDGLTGTAFVDDKQVVQLQVWKRWGEPDDSTFIRVWRVE